MTASLRNAIHRRNHKERSQPAERAKWGLLEKRKDYKLRSRDYNAKKKALKALSAKAALRNPDEFNFKMMSSRTSNGVKITQRGDVGGKALDNDLVKVLKTQDAGYIRTLAAEERSKIKELEDKLGFVGEGGGAERHTVFVDDEEKARTLNPAEFFGTEEELVERGWNRLRKEQIPAAAAQVVRLEGAEGDEEEKKERKRLARERKQRYKELEARMKRLGDLEKMEREVEEQRGRMGKGSVPKGGKPGQGLKVRKR